MTASNGLPRQTLIIIVVCASVGGLILAYLIYRTIRSLSRPSSIPLPPIQPLAHHREHQLARFEQAQERHDSAYLAAGPPPRFSSRSLSSKTSLLGKETATSDSHFSLSPTSVEDATAPQLLPPPLPSFYSSRPSSSGSSASRDSSPSRTRSSQPPPPMPPSSWSSAATSPNDSSIPRQPRPDSSIPRQPRPDSSIPRQPRPKSMSSHHTVRSRSSRSNIRGTPHGPHSNVQIILPAPLSQGLAVAPSSDSVDRRSMVDRWVPAGRDGTDEAFIGAGSFTGGQTSIPVNYR